jgi:hypothetical protein
MFVAPCDVQLAHRVQDDGNQRMLWKHNVHIYEDLRVAIPIVVISQRVARIMRSNCTLPCWPSLRNLQDALHVFFCNIRARRIQHTCVCHRHQLPYTLLHVDLATLHHYTLYSAKRCAEVVHADVS